MKSSSTVFLNKYPKPQGSTVTLSDGRKLGFQHFRCPHHEDIAYIVNQSKKKSKTDQLSSYSSQINSNHDSDQLEFQRAPVVLFLPGLPCSRFFVPPGLDLVRPDQHYDSVYHHQHHHHHHHHHHILGNRNGRTSVYVLERPGYGLSTTSCSAHERDSVIAYAKDIEEFLDILSIERTSVAVVGYSAGGPYAIALAHALKVPPFATAVVSGVAPAPSKFDKQSKRRKRKFNIRDFSTKVLAPNSFAPMNSAAPIISAANSFSRPASGVAPSTTFLVQTGCPKATKGMAPMFKIAWILNVYAPSVVSHVVKQEAKSFRICSPENMKKDFDWFHQVDRDFCAQNPWVENIFIDSLYENYSRFQQDTDAIEYSLWKRWGFSLDQVNIHQKGALTFWQGDKDKACTLAMATYMHHSIHNSDLRIFKDKGHLLFFEIWDEVIAWINMRFSSFNVNNNVL